MASTLNPFATGIASVTAGVVLVADVLRLIFFVVMTAWGTYFVYRYADRFQKKDPTKSLVYSHREEDLEAL